MEDPNERSTEHRARQDDRRMTVVAQEELADTAAVMTATSAQ